MASMQWPRRTHLCLSCRTAVPDNTACGCDHLALVPLASANGRGELMARVWGPVLRPGTTPTWVKVLVVLLSPLAALGMLPEYGVAGLIVAFLVCPALVWKILAYQSRRSRDVVLRQHILPIGASETPRRLASGDRISGVVTARAQLRAPVTGRPCAGFSCQLSLVDADGLKVMLRDAATVGFEVVADGGEVVTIPAGHIELFGAGSRAISSEVTLRQYVNAVAPRSNDREANTPFPCQRGDELIVADGARVMVHSPIRMRPDPHAPMRGYRQGAAAIHEVVGVPRVEIISLTG